MKPNIEDDEGFSVCVLIYGDYPALARRCLDSIFNGIDPQYVKEIRVGLNGVSEHVRNYVFERMKSHHKFSRLVYEPTERTNVLKYPLMRRMFYDNERPLQGSHIMWFDDDSCRIGVRPGWWPKVWASAQTADMVGDLFVFAFQGRMREGIQAQPWYTGKPWCRHKGREVLRFITGGWWAGKTEIIQKWNYPWPELVHNGGDCTLGELMRQQGHTLQSFKDGLWINANAAGKMSGAKRRGATKKLLWYDYRPDQQPNYDHHEFDLTVHEL